MDGLQLKKNESTPEGGFGAQRQSATSNPASNTACKMVDCFANPPYAEPLIRLTRVAALEPGLRPPPLIDNNMNGVDDFYDPPPVTWKCPAQQQSGDAQ